MSTLHIDYYSDHCLAGSGYILADKNRHSGGNPIVQGIN